VFNTFYEGERKRIRLMTNKIMFSFAEEYGESIIRFDLSKRIVSATDKDETRAYGFRVQTRSILL